MNDFIHESFKMAGQRLGTLVGASLGGYGFAQSDINSLVAGVVAVSGIVADLVIIYLRNRKGR